MAKKKPVDEQVDSNLMLFGSYTNDELIMISLKKEYEIIKENNPVGMPRLKRKIVLEYLTQRIAMLEKESEEFHKARELLEKQEGQW